MIEFFVINNDLRDPIRVDADFGYYKFNTCSITLGWIDKTTWKWDSICPSYELDHEIHSMICKAIRKDKFTFTLARTIMNVGYSDNKTYGYIQKLVLNYDDKTMKTF